MWRRISLDVTGHPDFLTLCHCSFRDGDERLSNVVDLEGRPLLSHVFSSKTWYTSYTSKLLPSKLARWGDGNGGNGPLVAGVQLRLQTVDLLLAKIPVYLWGRSSSIGLATDAAIKGISLD